VYVIQHGVRTNKHLSFETAKSGVEKTAKGKGISVAELVRRIIDKELHRGQKQKGEPLIAAAGAAAEEHHASGAQGEGPNSLSKRGPFIRQLRAYRHRGMTCTAGLWHLGRLFSSGEKIFRGLRAQKKNMKVWQAARCALPTPRESGKPAQDNVKREPSQRKPARPIVTPEHKRSTDNRHQTKEAHPHDVRVKRM